MASPTAWSVLPGQESAAFARLPAIFPAPSAPPVADVFYVHPTSYVGAKWNGPVDDAALNAATDRVATRIRERVLDCCAVYAPRYRQANGMAFIKPFPTVTAPSMSRMAMSSGRFGVPRPTADRGRDAAAAVPHRGAQSGTMLAYRLLRNRSADDLPGGRSSRRTCWAV